MKLVLSNAAFYHNGLVEADIFFEHHDIFSAKYEIIAKTQDYIKKWPEELCGSDCSIMSRGMIKLNGFQLTYAPFLDFRELPGKNKLIKPARSLFKAVLVEPNIITLDEWFASHREGHPWDNLLHSVIKNNSNKEVDNMLSSL